jgi:hypothetical protein
MKLVVAIIFSIASLSTFYCAAQSIEYGSTNISDAPMALEVYDDQRFLIASTSVQVPENTGASLPYQTLVMLMNQSGEIEQSWEFENFVAQSIISWNNEHFLFGSGQTNTGIYSLDLYRITEGEDPQSYFHQEAEDTSLVARQAYVDPNGQVLLCARRYFGDLSDFSFYQLVWPSTLLCSAQFNGPEFSPDYLIAEIPDLPDKYFIRSSGGLNMYLGEDLQTFSVINSAMEPLNLMHESGLTLFSDSTYLVAGDNIGDQGFGNQSAYIVERNAIGEVLTWFEAIDETEEWTNSGSGMIVDEINDELWLGLSSKSEFPLGIVPEARMGLARYSLEGDLLSSDFQHIEDRFLSARQMIRFPNGIFVLSGISAPAGLPEDVNQLDIVISFFDNGGQFLHMVETPLVQNPKLVVNSYGAYTVSGFSDQTDYKLYIFDAQGCLLEHSGLRIGDSGRFRSETSGIYLFQLVNSEGVVYKERKYIESN